MINLFKKKIINFSIIIILGIQFYIYLINQNPSTENFSQKKITVENFSSIVLSNSGITKIGSEKQYKIYGKNISIDLTKEISSSDESVEVINKMGLLKAEGFKNHDYDGKIFFVGKVEFIINE